MKSILFKLYTVFILAVFFTFTRCEKDSDKTPTISDIDGNVYKIVNIGTQVWMAENLKTITYNDGTAITNVTDATEWSNLTTEAYCNFNNTTNADTINTYGRLYNWYAVETDKLCPSGWHVPSNEEWIDFEEYLIANGYNYDGSTTDNKIAKSLATANLWHSSTNTGAVGNNDYPEIRNKTGFSALPAGNRSDYGLYYNINQFGFWWSYFESNTDYAKDRYLHYDDSCLTRTGTTKACGLSVRCVRED